MEDFDPHLSSFTGNFVVGTTDIIRFYVKDDFSLDEEGEETFNLKLDNIDINNFDSVTQKTINVDDSITEVDVTINDTSFVRYDSITHNAGSDNSITEGGSVTFTLHGINMVNGYTSLTWVIHNSGAPIQGSLSGTFTIPVDGDSSSFIATIPTTDDNTWNGEGSRSFYLTVEDDSGNELAASLPVNVLDNELRPPEYDSITPSPTSITEGGNVTFTLNGSYMLNGETNLNWELYDVSSGLSFSTSTLGTFEVDSNTTQTITTVVTVDDDVYTGTRSFRLKVKDGNGNELSTSPTVNVLDDEFSPPEYYSITHGAGDDNSITEGGSVTFVLRGKNMYKGFGADRSLTWVIHNSGAPIEGGISGTFTIPSNGDSTALIKTVHTINDNTWNGTGSRSFYLTVEDDSGNELRRSSEILVLDNEFSPPEYYSIGDGLTYNNKSITEGGSVTFTLYGKNMYKGAGADRSLTWKIYNSNAPIQGSLSGTFTIPSNGDSSAFIKTVYTTDDNTWNGEGSRSFYLTVEDDSGNELERSSEILVLDNESAPPVLYTSITDNATNNTVEEGQSVTFTLNGSNMLTGTGADTSLGWQIIDIVGGVTFSGNTSGNFTVNSESSVTITTVLTADDSSLNTAERSFKIIVKNDSAQTLVTSDKIIVTDNEEGVSYTSITDNATNNTIEEGQSVTFTLNGSNMVTGVGANSSLYWEINDISGNIGSRLTSLTGDYFNVTNETSQNITTVTFQDDASYNGNGSFQLRVRENEIGTIIKSSDIITITDNESPPVITTYDDLYASDYSLDEDPPNNQTTITLTGTNLSGSHTCSIIPVTNNITGADFTSGILSVTLTSNEARTQATGTITIAADSTTEEGPQTFYVELDDDRSKTTSPISISDTSKTPVVPPTYTSLIVDSLNNIVYEGDSVKFTLNGSNMSGETLYWRVVMIEPYSFTNFDGYVDTNYYPRRFQIPTGSVQISESESESKEIVTLNVSEWICYGVNGVVTDGYYVDGQFVSNNQLWESQISYYPDRKFKIEISETSNGTPLLSSPEITVKSPDPYYYGASVIDDNGNTTTKVNEGDSVTIRIRGINMTSGPQTISWYLGYWGGYPDYSDVVTYPPQDPDVYPFTGDNVNITGNDSEMTFTIENFILEDGHTEDDEKFVLIMTFQGVPQWDYDNGVFQDYFLVPCPIKILSNTT